MSSPYYVNSEDDPIWCVSAFTKAGAWVLVRTYCKKMGCTLVEEPMERDDGMWMFMVSNPFMEPVASS